MADSMVEQVRTLGQNIIADNLDGISANVAVMGCLEAAIKMLKFEHNCTTVNALEIIALVVAQITEAEKAL